MVAQRSAPGIRIVWLQNEKAKSGEPLDLDGRVKSFTYEDNDKKADKVSIVLDNFDLSLFERTDIANGSVLEVAWGYPGNMSPPRRVVLQKLKGFQELTLEGVATTVLHGKQARTRAWFGMTRSQVVEQVAGELGYSGTALDIDATSQLLDVINQSAESDAAFLRRLASKEHFVFFIDQTGLHWHARRKGAAPTHVLVWYSDQTGTLQNVSVESDLMRRVGKVVVKGRDPLQRKTFEQSGDSASVDRPTTADVVEVVNAETAETSIQTRNATSTEHASSASTAEAAKSEAATRFRRAEAEAVKLTLTIVGDPTLQAKSVVELQGISTLLSGKYYLPEVKHVIDGSGYIITAKAVRDGVGRRSGLSSGTKDQGKSQGGTPNRNEASTGGELEPKEVVNAWGDTELVFKRRPGQRLGAGDPEAKAK